MDNPTLMSGEKFTVKIPISSKEIAFVSVDELTKLTITTYQDEINNLNKEIKNLNKKLDAYKREIKEIQCVMQNCVSDLDTDIKEIEEIYSKLD